MCDSVDLDQRVWQDESGDLHERARRPALAKEFAADGVDRSAVADTAEVNGDLDDVIEARAGLRRPCSD
jgi:hypothetical protein